MNIIFWRNNLQKTVHIKLCSFSINSLSSNTKWQQYWWASLRGFIMFYHNEWPTTLVEPINYISFHFGSHTFVTSSLHLSSRTARDNKLWLIEEWSLTSGNLSDKQKPNSGIYKKVKSKQIRTNQIILVW